MCSGVLHVQQRIEERARKRQQDKSNQEQKALTSKGFVLRAAADTIRELDMPLAGMPQGFRGSEVDLDFAPLSHSPAEDRA